MHTGFEMILQQNQFRLPLSNNGLEIYGLKIYSLSKRI